MEKFLRFLFSMKMMAVGMIIFLVAIGTATILESKFNIQAAKIIIYNAMWFEILLVYLGLNLVANIFRYKMFQREKIAVLMFHLSFIVIIIGAGITRYISFEGQMRLPEADQATGTLRPVDFIYSAEPKLDMNIDGYAVKFPLNNTLYLSEITNNYFKHDFHFGKKNKNVSVEYIDFKSKHVDSLVVNDTISDYVIDIVTGGMNSNYMTVGDVLMAGQVPISFGRKNTIPGVELLRVKNQMMLKTNLPMTYLPMSEMQKARESGMEIPDSMYVTVPVDSLVPLRITTLYKVEGEQFVFKGLINHARKMLMPTGRKDVGMDYLTLKISDGKESKTVVLKGGIGQMAEQEVFQMGGCNYKLAYGSVPIVIPFSIACNDFRLERYPGRDAQASSFESTVTVIDPKKEKNHTQVIFMNNVMDYDGYRFFQSGYYPDESGTILSVNHDWWGTNVTYLGYLLMAIGMMMSLFSPAGRFRELFRKLAKTADESKNIGAVILIALLSFNGIGQEGTIVEEDHSGHNHATHEGHDHADHNHEGHSHEAHNHSQTSPEPAVSELSIGFISKDHAEKIEKLLVQDFDGRTAPLHTICDELLRKIHRSNKYEDPSGNKYNAVQTILSMHMTPEAWMSRKIVYVSEVLRDTLGLEGKYASINDLLAKDKTFKLADDYQKAHNKLDKNKGEYDKQLIKLVERYQIIAGFPNWTYLKISPVRSDATQNWYPPTAEEVIVNEEELFRVSMEYFKELFLALKSGDYNKADKSLDVYMKLQREVAGDLAPSERKIALEVSYNKMNIFKNAQYSYLILGFALLFLYIVRLALNAEREEGKGLKIVRLIFTWLLAVIFLYHCAGLGIRWYISGNAPWSNGYEAVIFIAWGAVLVGFIFMRFHQVVLALCSILAFCMIFVTEMNILDPEITTLQPVLKSYWLMIHVSIITNSYAWLGLGAIIGWFNLGMYIFRKPSNGKLLTTNINVLTHVSEMLITIGLFMLTIGTFLGGIWANESWGRYWGWDPKETWALVSVLVYAVILHLRFIPALKSKFTFNVVSFWGYSAIIFTFFGVNFYLTGLHSYAQGEGLAVVPNWIFYVVLALYIFTELSWLMYKRFVLYGEILNLKFFLRKVMYLFSAFFFIYLLLWIFKAMTSAEFTKVSLTTLAIFASTNLLLFVLNKFLPKFKAHESI